MGVQDILIAGKTIAAIGKNLSVPVGYDCQEIQLDGKCLFLVLLTAMYIDWRWRRRGYATRTPEVLLSSITTSGVTTVVGCLGTDGTTRHVASLLAKARGLEAEGISTYIYTGAYELPTQPLPAVCAVILLLLIKLLALAKSPCPDHRSAQPSIRNYQKLAAEARVGGMLSGKANIVDMHLGDGSDKLDALFAVTQNGEIQGAVFANPFKSQ